MLKNVKSTPKNQRTHLLLAVGGSAHYKVSLVAQTRGNTSQASCCLSDNIT